MSLSVRAPHHVLSLVALARMTLALGNQTLPALTPFLLRDLGMSRTDVGLAFAADRFGNALTVIPGGWMVDRIGVRYVLVVAQALSALALLGLALANSGIDVAFCLFIAGIGVGVGDLATTIALFQWYPANQRGTAIGIKQTMVPIVVAATAILLPLVGPLIGWRLTCYVMSTLTLIGISFVLFRYAEHPQVAASRRAATTTLLAVLRSPSLLVVTFYGIAFGIMTAASLAYLLLYLIEVLRYPFLAAGFILAFSQAGSLLGRLGWGMTSDRVFSGSRRQTLALVGVIAVASTFGLASLSAESTLVVVGLLVFAHGASAHGWQPLFVGVVPELVDRETAGSSLGYVSALSMIGPVVGAPIFGFTVDYWDSYALAWIVTTTPATLATLLVFVALRERSAD